MEWLVPFVSAFGLVAIAELGDKTQILAITLASRHPRLPVFGGALLAEAGMVALGVTLGTTLYVLAPLDLVKIVAGSLFVIFGIWTFLSKEKHEEVAVEKMEKVFISSFGLVFLAEIGDKTQLAVVALTAQFQAPLLVLLGSIAALSLMMMIGVLLGRVLSLRISMRRLEIASALLFLGIGALMIVEAFVPIGI